MEIERRIIIDMLERTGGTRPKGRRAFSDSRSTLNQKISAWELIQPPGSGDETLSSRSANSNRDAPRFHHSKKLCNYRFHRLHYTGTAMAEHFLVFSNPPSQSRRCFIPPRKMGRDNGVRSPSASPRRLAEMLRSVELGPSARSCRRQARRATWRHSSTDRRNAGPAERGRARRAGKNVQKIFNPAAECELFRLLEEIPRYGTWRGPYKGGQGGTGPRRAASAARRLDCGLQQVFAATKELMSAGAFFAGCPQRYRRRENSRQYIFLQAGSKILVELQQRLHARYFPVV